MLLSFKMHTQDNSDYSHIPESKHGDNWNAYQVRNIDVEQQKTSKLVLEMTSRYFNTNQIVNMDRYYGSNIGGPYQGSN